LLTTRDLAIIRAALQFFDEEISPHGPEVAKPYFETPLEDDLTAEEIGQLRELLQSTELSYVRCDQSRTHVLSQELLTFEKLQRIPHQSEEDFATVLLTSAR